MTTRRAAWAAGAGLAMVLLAGLPGEVWGQPASRWHMVAGQRAWAEPRGTLDIALGPGTRLPPRMPGIEVTLSNPDASGARTVARICCLKPAGAPIQCTSDRSVGLDSPRQFVISRYGASRSAGSSLQQLNYPGIEFSFDNLGRTTRICVVPLRQPARLAP